MKILNLKPIRLFFLVCFAAALLSCSGKSSKTAGNNNPMADAFLKSQKSAEVSTEAHSLSNAQKINITDYIQYDKNIAVKDSGSKKIKNITAMELVREMKTGWNLGNTLDATSATGLASETSWGQPKVTKKMFDGLASSGIKTVRIPVSWSRHIIDSNYTIDSQWMLRVKQIVDWALEDGLYVILNIHHDNYEKNEKMPHFSGFYPTDENYEESLRFVNNIWAQICLAFNNGYDEHLVFEVLNEPRLCGTEEEWWYNPKSPKSIEAMKNLNKLNQSIVDVIRSSGGNNQKRMLAIPSLQASPDSALAAAFKMPEDFDGVKSRLILSVHMYTPYNFAMESPGIKEFTPEIENEFVWMFRRLNDSFIANGYAVYVGEYGATNKNNLQDRVLWFESFIKNARAYGISCFLWDNGVWQVKDDDYSEHYGFYDRQNQNWYFPEIIKAINAGIN